MDAQGLTPEQTSELDRRLEDIEKNPGKGVPWENVLAAARRQNKKPKPSAYKPDAQAKDGAE